MKGPPYLPEVSGTSICSDDYSSSTPHTCSTFNQADIDNIKSYGWNAIRLGVTWAGAQPTDADELDPEFVRRLHALLNLTDANGINGTSRLCCAPSTPTPYLTRNPQ